MKKNKKVILLLIGVLLILAIFALKNVFSRSKCEQDWKDMTDKSAQHLRENGVQIPDNWSEDYRDKYYSSFLEQNCK